MKIYLDGVLTSIPTELPSYPMQQVNSSFKIGGGDTERFFTGSIDDVRMYKAAVPTSQIQEQYYAGLNKLLANGGITKEEYIERSSVLASGN
jgi:hypothetical protein